MKSPEIVFNKTFFRHKILYVCLLGLCLTACGDETRTPSPNNYKPPTPVSEIVVSTGQSVDFVNIEGNLKGTLLSEDSSYCTLTLQVVGANPFYRDNTNSLDNSKEGIQTTGGVYSNSKNETVKFHESDGSVRKEYTFTGSGNSCFFESNSYNLYPKQTEYLPPKTPQTPMLPPGFYEFISGPTATPEP